MAHIGHIINETPIEEQRWVAYTLSRVESIGTILWLKPSMAIHFYVGLLLLVIAIAMLTRGYKQYVEHSKLDRERTAFLASLKKTHTKERRKSSKRH